MKQAGLQPAGRSPYRRPQRNREVNRAAAN